MSNATQIKGFSGVQDGGTFQIGGIEFIKFPDQDGMTPVVARNIAFDSSFGRSNDFRQSDILKKLQTKFLPQIIAAVGEENLCTIKTDLTTLDGLKTYGVMETLISLPTLDFYRANVEIFDQHKVDRWWWLATPDSAAPHCDHYWALCVSPRGDIRHDRCSGVNGVRPFLIFKSSIFKSSEE